MGSYRRPRPRFMSSPVLSDLARFHASSPALQLSNASVWNSVQIAVIKVFQGGGLQTNELHSLNESIRWLQRTELGSFMPEYFQDQLLNKGLVHVLEKIQLHEYWLQALSEVWVAFFTEILPTLQAIFYPVQGQELTVRQMALLGFRNLVLLKLPLKNMLHTASYPPAIIQMLLILQGIHEPGGPSKEYYLLESLVDMVISPYLSNYLSVSQMDSFSECQLEQSKLATIPHFGQPEITVTHFAQEPPLAPLVEHEGEAYLERTGGVRRHTVANAHSDIQLLSVMSRMHPGDASAVRATKAGKGGSPRPCCSEPVTILDTPTAPSGSLRHQSTAEMTCELTS
ncbi:proline-rich protein 5-like isoform X2 [Electrophorus electricus]|uniref:proline-rich protein 5-like isoform X2 n=1 Tax=Electrophorus electricus TaxID=8005 RepID=UPI0015CFD855|nr:proline-rich protein 5-like isoform X2 [Electrophorus electricus]